MYIPSIFGEIFIKLHAIFFLVKIVKIFVVIPFLNVWQLLYLVLLVRLFVCLLNECMELTIPKQPMRVERTIIYFRFYPDLPDGIEY